MNDQHAPPAAPLDVGRELLEVRGRRIHNLLELERVPRAAGIDYRRKFVAGLQVHPEAHRLADLFRKRLGVVCPREGVEIDEHVVALTHVSNHLEQRTIRPVNAGGGALQRVRLGHCAARAALAVVPLGCLDPPGITSLRARPSAGGCPAGLE
eukprot:7387467-Prymnesium_polylepis.2